MGYECLLAGLPDLKAGGEAPMSIDALMELFGEMLTEKDLQLLSVLRIKETITKKGFVNMQ